MNMNCFYCNPDHEGRKAIMFKVGDMKAGTLYLFKDQNGDLVPGINSEIAWLFICCYIEQ